ncbi:snRNA-activating protein of 50kDa MW C terminal-domain-containing protein [Phycomyces blakesleeanus]
MNPEDMRESSDFFNDPTLLSHIKRYKESKENKTPQSQVRRMNGADCVIKRKPQAKSVAPHRVLAKEDEAIYLETQKELDKDSYLNPQVPKRRVYLAQTHVPAFLLSLGSPQNQSSPQTSSLENRDTITNETTSTTNDRGSLDFEERSTGSAEKSHLDSTGSKVANNYNEDNIETIDNEISMMENSSVPETELSRELIYMANRIKRSRLQTLSLDSNADLLPRQYKQLNYIAMKQRNNKVSNGGKKPKTKSKKTNASAGTKNTQPNYMHSDSAQSLIRIAVYHPKIPSKLLQEFSVLGSQTLATFKDAIYCINCAVSDVDPKDIFLNNSVSQNTKETSKSSSFFIEDTLYIDTRPEKLNLNSNDKDITKQEALYAPEVENAIPKGVILHPRQSMEDVTFGELRLQLNHPYLFTNHNSCSHMVMVRDIRLCDYIEAMEIEQGPRLEYTWKFVRYKCNMCLTYPAKYITFNDILSGTSPCYFCEKCFGPFHFDKDGNKTSSFQYIPYNGI